MLLGTPSFMAPEIFWQHGSAAAYQPSVDIWACGITMYMLLSAHYPFWSKNEDELKEMICNGTLKFDYQAFSLVPESAKDLMTKMLDKNAARRITARECLEHEFFSELMATE